MTAPDRPAGADGTTTGAMLRAAGRRFVGLLVVIAGGTALLSLLLGLAIGAGISRSISLGFYLVGSFLLISGFFVGNRGPVRVKGDPGFGMFGFFRNRRLRWATGSEQIESLSLSVVFVALGLALIVLGVLTDTRYELI
jgi:hypothetical protein